MTLREDIDRLYERLRTELPDSRARSLALTNLDNTRLWTEETLRKHGRVPAHEAEDQRDGLPLPPDQEAASRFVISPRAAPRVYAVNREGLPVSDPPSPMLRGPRKVPGLVRDLLGEDVIPASEPASEAASLPRPLSFEDLLDPRD